MALRLDELQFAVIDTETTGFYPSRDRVVEVAIEVVDSRGEPRDRYATLVDPGPDAATGALGGISPNLLFDAPRFEEVAGDVLARLANAVWVGHNLGFDVGFLRAEYERLGYRLGEVPSLCTMRLAHHFGPDVDCYRLEWLCHAFGISCPGPRTSARCAAATAQLLARLLDAVRSSGRQRLEDLADLGFATVEEPFLSADSVPFPTSGRGLARDRAGSAPTAATASYIRRVVADLKPMSGERRVADDQLGFYLHLLDRVLQDRRIEPEEQDELVGLATEWDFALEDVRRAHEIYVGMLVATALDEGTITSNERDDLAEVCALLGVSPETMEAMVERARSARR